MFETLHPTRRKLHKTLFWKQQQQKPSKVNQRKKERKETERELAIVTPCKSW